MVVLGKERVEEDAKLKAYSHAYVFLDCSNLCGCFLHYASANMLNGFASTNCRLPTTSCRFARAATESVSANAGSPPVLAGNPALPHARGRVSEEGRA